MKKRIILSLAVFLAMFFYLANSPGIQEYNYASLLEMPCGLDKNIVGFIATLTAGFYGSLPMAPEIIAWFRR